MNQQPSTTYRIAVIPGDGIGLEVVPEALRVVDAVATGRGFAADYTQYPWGCAFELARRRGKHLTSATKSNGIIHTMPYWDERFAALAEEYPDVRTDQYHIDILAAHFVRHPEWFDVVVASNLFGDILSDLGPAVVGGMGIAAGANINIAHLR